MAVPFSNTKLRVPKGFQNIIEGLAREILRSQPENMFEFGSKYFDQLMKVREETGHDPAVHGARLEDRFYNNDSFKSPSVDPSSPEQQDAALTIQTNYRKHVAEQDVSELRQEEAAEKIQAGFRGQQDRQKFEEKKDEQKEEEEVDIDLNDPDVEQAAIKIQAGFKGFKARQEVKDKKSSHATLQADQTNSAGVTDEVDIDLEDPDVEKAAIKIQASFRKHLSKQDLVQKPSQSGTTDNEPGTSGTSGVSTSNVTKPAEEEEIDIDLNDPEVAHAAQMIQKGFKKRMFKKK